MHFSWRARHVALLIALLPAAAQAQGSATADSAAAVDRIFANWNARQTPGCAVGVARNGQTILERAYGMANLEYDVPNTPATIFEAGSVSKQFTAAAVVLLAQQGKLSLDDEVSKYIPELPDYDTPITIRQMLHHTSGLRDWGTVAAAMGWPRGTRAHTHAHVLDIASRQESLNYMPGTEYLYSNTNYNLAAIIVERVSGMSFAEFTRRNLFEPLGMTSTQWRDDYTRIVKGRATAYGRGRQGGWGLEMPFEDVHGNGGLLTTVGDLLKWNENFVRPRVGGVGFVRDLQQQGRLTSGREISYALGLVVSTYQGVPEVSHTGATAGYRAFLARYPAQHLSVAVLCNAGNANPNLGQRVADIFLAGQARLAARQAGEPDVALPPEQIAEKAGVYRNLVTNEPMRLVMRDGKLHIADGPELTPLSRTAFRAPNGTVGTFEFGAKGLPAILRLARTSGDTVSFLLEAPWTPTVTELRQYVGEYASNEAETTYGVTLEENGKLMLRGRYGRTLELVPAYRHAFTTSQGPGLVLFRRDARGRVTTMSFGMGRVRDLHFKREGR
ncbi:MAG: beta-lactamase family protein [Gemmatimonadota bacterium]|nr:beta-lactamase family protein [Gemmatimonadota bacterium]